jgi:hypothetical protein
LKIQVDLVRGAFLPAMEDSKENQLRERNSPEARVRANELLARPI